MLWKEGFCLFCFLLMKVYVKFNSTEWFFNYLHLENHEHYTWTYTYIKMEYRLLFYDLEEPSGSHCVLTKQLEDSIYYNWGFRKIRYKKYTLVDKEDLNSVSHVRNIQLKSASLSVGEPDFFLKSEFQYVHLNPFTVDGVNC